MPRVKIAFLQYKHWLNRIEKNSSAIYGINEDFIRRTGSSLIGIDGMALSLGALNETDVQLLAFRKRRRCCSPPSPKSKNQILHR